MNSFQACLILANVVFICISIRISFATAVRRHLCTGCTDYLSNWNDHSGTQLAQVSIQQKYRVYKIRWFLHVLFFSSVLKIFTQTIYFFLVNEAFEKKFLLFRCNGGEEVFFVIRVQFRLEKLDVFHG